MSDPIEQAEIASEIINSGGNLNTQENLGMDYSLHLVKLLRESGWKNATAYDYCSKAIYEAYLQREGAKVRIITANFMGVFTQIETKGNFTDKNNSIRFMDQQKD